MRIIFSLLLSLTLTATAFAQAADQKTDEQIRAQLKTVIPDMPIDNISETPVPGIYMITTGPQVIYISADGKYLIQGDMYDIRTAQPVNLTEVSKESAVKKTIDAVNTDTMIIYPAKEQQTYITVLTDPDCTYCRALHKEVPQLNDAGITVRYIAFPRTPKGTPSYNKSIYIWCADDRNQAFTDAINDNPPASNNCKHPVDEHRQIVDALGVSVTPVIIFENGRQIPGYLPADKLIEAVNQYGR